MFLFLCYRKSSPGLQFIISYRRIVHFSEKVFSILILHKTLIILFCFPICVYPGKFCPGFESSMSQSFPKTKSSLFQFCTKLLSHFFVSQDEREKESFLFMLLRVLPVYHFIQENSFQVLISINIMG